MRTKILVVDDDPDLLLLLRVTLAAEDFQSLLARNGEDALREIQNERPDLVLLDIMMPVVDGWAVLRKMTEQGFATPVVVVSAKASEADVARALELGAVDYVTKPFDPEEIVQSILWVLDRSPEDRDRRRIERLAAISSGRTA